MSEIFLSYSRNDNTAASALRAALERAGLQVFKDDASLRSGAGCPTPLQTAVSRCDAFVVQVGLDGVQRWNGLRVAAADASRLRVSTRANAKLPADHYAFALFLPRGRANAAREPAPGRWF